MLSVAPPVPPTIGLRWLNALISSASKLKTRAAESERFVHAEVCHPQPRAVEINILTLLTRRRGIAEELWVGAPVGAIRSSSKKKMLPLLPAGH